MSYFSYADADAYFAFHASHTLRYHAMLAATLLA